MASSTSSPPGSTAHLSHNASPSASQQTPKPRLETLIGYLLASKRSLSSIHQVHRATTILSRARSHLESTAVLAARTTFLQRSLASQLKILRRVQFELENVVHNGQAEFSSILKELDEAGKRLEQTIHRMKSTKIEPGFRSTDVTGRGTSESKTMTEPKESLYDFIDAHPVEELKDSLKDSIGEVQQAKSEMEQSLQDFEEDLQAVNNALRAKTAISSSSSSTFQPPSVPTILKGLENHAREAAASLESLVKHFDLCVTAIQHTEGGGAAVAKNLEVAELPEGVNVEGFRAPTHSITEDEKKEMMAVLDNDAAEVEDVVIEIQDRIAQMESQLDQVLLWKERQESENEEILTAMKLLEQVGTKLPGYIQQSQAFMARWSEEKLKIKQGMAGLEDLRDVYRNFLRAYDGLIVEVARRKAARNQMEKVVRETHTKLQQLYEDDIEEREAFRVDQGEYLPMDIWPGLSEPPVKYAFSRVGNDDANMPDVPRKTVEEALKRLKTTSLQP